MPPPGPVQLHEIVGVLLLAHKYNVPYLYRRALEHISGQFYFPSVEAYRSSNSPIEKPWNIKFSGSYAEPNASELFSLIKACKTVGADWLLPMAYYYACCHIRQEDMLSMTDKEDEHHSRLCLSACRSLIVNKVAAAFRFLKPYFTEDCLDSKRCENVRQAMWSHVLGTVQEPLDVAPLDSWREEWWEQLYPHGNSTPDPDEPSTFCVPCHGASKMEHDNFLRECWDRLPFFFHLPGWSELEALRQTVPLGRQGIRTGTRTISMHRSRSIGHDCFRQKI
jgi:hypothetical protein